MPLLRFGPPASSQLPSLFILTSTWQQCCWQQLFNMDKLGDCDEVKLETLRHNRGRSASPADAATTWPLTLPHGVQSGALQG